MKRFFTKSFFTNFRFKYKVSILNENTLEETLHFRLSRLNVFLVTCSFLLITFIINSVLIIKTPLKQFLPGYENTTVRADIIHSTMTVDSLSYTIKRQEKYLEVLRNIVSGNIKVEKSVDIDSLMLHEREKIKQEKSKTEKEFCENFEKEEQFNLSILDVPKTQKTVFFKRPVKGVVSTKFSIANTHYGVNVSTSPNENVSSILEGTVLYAGFTIMEGYVIVIQHDNNYISIYKNNSELLKNTGAKVNAGESIAILRSNDNHSKENEFHFELWQKGKPLNPEDYIVF